MVKVRLRGPDGEIETPWAEPVHSNLFRLDNLPWFAYGVSDDDVVEATVTDDAGVFEFVRVVTPSGNRLIRIVLDDPADATGVLPKLLAMGCHYEGLNRRFVAVNIPPTVDLNTVTAYVTAAGVTWENAKPTYEQVVGHH